MGRRIAVIVALAAGLLRFTVPAAASTPAPGFSDTPLVSGLEQPTAIAFLPDGRLLVTEKGGALKLVTGGSTTTLITLPVCTIWETGLLGIALDPAFAVNGWVYLYRTKPLAGCGPHENQVVRVTLAPDGTVDPATLVELLGGINLVPGAQRWRAAHFMIVRIKLRQGQAPARKRRAKTAIWLWPAGALLIPASLMAYVLGFWRLASDIGVTGEFALRGVFSHWQIWIVTAVALHITASVLTRYGRGGDFHLPSALTFRFGAGPDEPPDPAARAAGRSGARRLLRRSALARVISSAVSARYLPISSPPISMPPIAVRTSFSTFAPSASTMRRTCRLRPSVMVISKKRVFGAVANALDDRRARRAVGEREALAQLVQLLVVEQEGRFHQIRFRHLRFGTGDVIAERGIVGQDQQAGGVLIQAAHRKHEVFHAGEQIVNGRPAFRILVSGQVAFGFVEQQVLLLARRERTAVELDAIVLRIDPHIRRLHFLAVDGDAAGADPTARFGARADSELGEDAVERPLLVVFRRVHSL